MAAASWANLIEEADLQEARDWSEDEREEWAYWNGRWKQYDDTVEDRVSGLKTAERLAEIFDAGTPYDDLYELIESVYKEVCIELGLVHTEPQPVVETHTPQEPPVYAEDDYVIDWTQPVIFRGEKRNGDGHLFYLHVPWDIVPGNELRAFIKKHVGLAKGYDGMTGFKLGGVKYVRTMPLAGQVNKTSVSYVQRTIDALLEHTDAELVQERWIINTQQLCTQSCRGANPESPCECVCVGDGHGGRRGDKGRRQTYTIHKGELLIEGFRQVAWKLHN